MPYSIHGGSATDGATAWASLKVNAPDALVEFQAESLSHLISRALEKTGTLNSGHVQAMQALTGAQCQVGILAGMVSSDVRVLAALPPDTWERVDRTMKRTISALALRLEGTSVLRLGERRQLRAQLHAAQLCARSFALLREGRVLSPDEQDRLDARHRDWSERAERVSAQDESLFFDLKDLAAVAQTRQESARRAALRTLCVSGGTAAVREYLCRWAADSDPQMVDDMAALSDAQLEEHMALDTLRKELGRAATLTPSSFLTPPGDAASLRALREVFPDGGDLDRERLRSLKSRRHHVGLADHLAWDATTRAWLRAIQHCEPAPPQGSRFRLMVPAADPDLMSAHGRLLVAGVQPHVYEDTMSLSDTPGARQHLALALSHVVRMGDLECEVLLVSQTALAANLERYDSPSLTVVAADDAPVVILNSPDEAYGGPRSCTHGTTLSRWDHRARSLAVSCATCGRSPLRVIPGHQLPDDHADAIDASEHEAYMRVHNAFRRVQGLAPDPSFSAARHRDGVLTPDGVPASDPLADRFDDRGSVEDELFGEDLGRRRM